MTDDRGSGTVWVMAMSLLIALGAVAGGTWGVGATARHRAEMAADLAALAAASDSLQGDDRACATASRIARDNGAHLVDCRLVGDVVEIEVSRPVQFGLMHGGTAVAKARAGPVLEANARTEP